MAQTARSIADLELLLADQHAKDISPRDLRDLMESSMGCYGALYTDGGTTAEGLTATPAIVTTWLSNGLYRNATPDKANGEITLSADGLYLLAFTASLLGSVGADRFHFALRKDAVLISGASAEVAAGIGDRVQVAAQNVVSVVAGAKISVYASAIGAAGDATLEYAQLTATRVG